MEGPLCCTSNSTPSWPNSLMHPWPVPNAKRCCWWQNAITFAFIGIPWCPKWCNSNNFFSNRVSRDNKLRCWSFPAWFPISRDISSMLVRRAAPANYSSHLCHLIMLRGAEKRSRWRPSLVMLSWCYMMVCGDTHPAVPFGTAAFETVPFGTVVNEWRVHLTLVTCD